MTLKEQIINLIGNHEYARQTFFESDQPSKEETTQSILTAVEEAMLECLPEKQNRKIDDEYGYCITCNQIVDGTEADCFCTIHNLFTAQASDNIKRSME